MTAKWWLVTWTTYGTWLPGDPRGFRTWRGREYVPPPKRYAQAGEGAYHAADYATRYQASRDQMAEPVRLSKQQCKIALAAIVDDVSQLSLTSAILSIGGDHCHFLSKFGELLIRQTVGRLKSAATRSLREHQFSAKRPWAKDCHMRSKPSDEEF